MNLRDTITNSPGVSQSVREGVLEQLDELESEWMGGREREIEKERRREGREEERVCQSVREGVLEQLDELESEWVGGRERDREREMEGGERGRESLSVCERGSVRAAG